MRKYYFLFLSLVCFSAYSQNINIPDATLKQAILGGGVWSNSPDTNGDGEISVAEAGNVLEVYYINSAGLGPHILNLDGIQNFPNMFSVNIVDTGNFTADFTALNNVPSLNLLTLSGGFSVGPLLNLSNLTLLTDVNLSINTTGATIDLSGMTSGVAGYRNVAVHSNFANILFNHPVLNTVDFSGCGLTYINLSTFSADDLHLQGNQFTSLDFTQASCQTVDISNNPFVILDLNGLYDSTNINCADLPNLQVLKISPAMTEQNSLWIENCPNLTVMDFKNYSNNFGVMGGIYIWSIPATVQTVCVDPEEYSGFFYEMDHCGGLNGCPQFGGTGCYSCQYPNTALTQYCNFITNINTITGNIKLDCGGLGQNLQGWTVETLNGSTASQTFTSNTGEYHLYGSQNTNITITPQIPNPAYFNISPPNYVFNFPTGGNNSTADFCVTANGVHPDLTVSLIPVSPARPGFDAQYKLVYQNHGNQTLSGALTLTYNDAVLDLVTASPTVSQQSLNTLVWDFTDIAPFQTHEISITLNVNSPVETPAVNIGDQLAFEANISPLSNDETPSDNTMAFNQTVIGSYDPNEKEVIEGSQVAIADADEYLHYIVRFQNMGTSEASNIVVADNLDYGKLDLTTFEILSASHPYRATLTNTNQLEVFFEAIDLPPASSDEPASHGYVAYRIKPKNTVSIGTTVTNAANIYFDYNAPIATNTVSTTFTALAAAQFNYENSISIHPNPAKNILNINSLNGIQLEKITIYNTIGQVVKFIEKDWSENSNSIDISDLNSGTYLITLSTSQGTVTKRFVKI